MQQKTIKTKVRNMALLMSAAVALSGCGSEEAGTKKEVQTVAGNEDGELKADERRQGSDEPGDITVDSPRELNEYRLCRKEMETENGIYILELRLVLGHSLGACGIMLSERE